MEVVMNPDLLTVILLYSLPQCFENFWCAIESRDELPTPEVLRVKIIEEHDARKNDTCVTGQGVIIAKRFEKRKNSKEKRGNVASQKPFKFKCHRCEKTGHKASVCHSRIEDYQTFAKNPEKGKMADTDDVCVFACAPTKKSEEQVAFQTREATHGMKWCLNNGCTSHLCIDPKKFVHLAKVVADKLNLANNTSTSIAGKRIVCLSAEIEGKTKNLNLEDALHVPDLRTNLLLISKITDEASA
ncbi:retrovirus-related pol polyprotein from transposon tnt 1-94 [Lasius niger]|uniref:Retrovirus-related pol polyprotein from transposon tnt 1-94 n=1 Tax=Lasius niger TaxID=67767 RepID=A0A0J7KBG3_LASNI|nr:retrovirus-related pol polyprotein from transposon tnt 1-94 [Lasius niger]